MNPKPNGFTLIELLIVIAVIVIAVIGTLAAIAVVLFSGTQQRTRIARAQADVRASVSALSRYVARTSLLPPDLETLTSPAANAAGVEAGPFIGRVPLPPSNGSPSWTVNISEGAFVVTGSGDGATVRAP